MNDDISAIPNDEHDNTRNLYPNPNSTIESIGDTHDY